MKAEIKTKEKGFEPIELNITIESMDELREICCRLNIAAREINKLDNDYGVISDSCHRLWTILDDVYEKRK